MHKHETENQLAEKLVQAATQVEVGGRYKHYKGLGYTVLTIALTEETCEPSVVYQAEYGKQIVYTRPLASWLEMVEVNGSYLPRFSRETLQQ